MCDLNSWFEQTLQFWLKQLTLSASLSLFCNTAMYEYGRYHLDLLFSLCHHEKHLEHYTITNHREAQVLGSLIQRSNCLPIFLFYIHYFLWNLQGSAGEWLCSSYSAQEGSVYWLITHSRDWVLRHNKGTGNITHGCTLFCHFVRAVKVASHF